MTFWLRCCTCIKRYAAVLACCSVSAVATKSLASAANGGAAVEAADSALAGHKPECAGFLAQRLAVSSNEAAAWLAKAARTRLLDSQRQDTADGGAPPPPGAITLAVAQLLINALADAIGMDAAGMAALLRNWPRLLGICAECRRSSPAAGAVC